MPTSFRAVVSASILVVAVACQSAPQSLPSPRRHLLILVDGLRPDYVRPDVMPHLVALGNRGAVFTRHHSVYPTVTRVNGASISTGAYPQTHGLLGNSVFFPTVDPAAFLDTSSRVDLQRIMRSEDLLTAPTLASALQAAGRRMLVISSGSAGSALLNNHTVAGGAVLHDTFALPETFGEAMQTLGPPPAAEAPAGTRDRYAVDAFLKVGLPRVDPSVTVLWLSDLDATAHDHGIGSPETVEVLRHVDTQIKRVEDGLREAGVLDSYNIWVTSDHGFSTYSGAVDLAVLLKPFARSLPDGTPRIVAGAGAIYVRDDDEPTVAAIVAALQRTRGAGAIFTAAAQPGSFDGRIPGTLSFDFARWNHPRSAQIQFSPDWTDGTNTHGFQGTSASNGTAGHGSSSPWDLHNTLIAAGPDLARGVTIDTPTANIDFAPTFLTLLGIAPPSTMQGRPLREALAGTDAPAASVRTLTHEVHTADRGYTLTATYSIVDVDGREHRYFDGTKVVRADGWHR